jgi:pyruvate dehydrogenase E2 component (dihydrolipoamide acetyltransferase)
MGVFAMPSLGADMEAGTLAEWLIEPGARVSRGDVVAVVETQKGAIEIEVFEDGVVDRLIAQEGERLPVGAPLAEIRGAGETAGEVAGAAAPNGAARAGGEAAPPATGAERAPRSAEAGTVGAARGPAGEGRPPPASPAARVRAREAGLDLAGVEGTGPGGAVRLADVEAALSGEAPAKAAPAGPARARPGLDPAAMRAAIAAAMARSKREIPHYYLSHTIDLQPAADWLAGQNARRPPEERLLMGALFVRATALAARAVPEMNGHVTDGAFRPAEAVHAGVVVALRGGGLIAPAIHGADALDLDATMAAMRDLVARARTGRLRGSEMTQGTITVSSLGDAGAETVAGVIYPPQVALAGFGAPVRRPWLVGEAIGPRMIVTVTLAADHRASDGRRGARFLDEIARHLQSPEEL